MRKLNSVESHLGKAKFLAALSFLVPLSTNVHQCKNEEKSGRSHSLIQLCNVLDAANTLEIAHLLFHKITVFRKKCVARTKWICQRGNAYTQR